MIENNDTFDAFLEVYIYKSFNVSTFGKVAIFNEKVFGVIFGLLNGEKPKYRDYEEDLTFPFLSLLKATNNDRENIIEYMSKTLNIYEELIMDKKRFL